jgi:ABC-2 type transport system ATP-binding protein
MHALEVKNVKKTYDTGKHALKGVDLTVEAGDVCALLGPNGAGKSTLINCIVGLVKKSSGDIEVFGTSIDKDHVTTKSNIGIVPQEFNFNIFEKVLDIVITQAGYYGVKRKIAMERAEVILKKLDLWDKRNAKSMTLSGGMKRRLMIARALVHQPKLLILDEPTAGVDVELRHGMWAFLRELSSGGTTIIMTTHYLKEAEELCNKVALIRDGQIILNGNMKDTLKSYGTDLESIYLKEISNKEAALPSVPNSNIQNEK